MLGPHSGAMSASGSAERHRLPLTVCLLFLSVISAVFIVAASVALALAGACWFR